MKKYMKVLRIFCDEVFEGFDVFYGHFANERLKYF